MNYLLLRILSTEWQMLHRLKEAWIKKGSRGLIFTSLCWPRPSLKKIPSVILKTVKDSRLAIRVNRSMTTSVRVLQRLARVLAPSPHLLLSQERQSVSLSCPGLEGKVAVKFVHVALISRHANSNLSLEC